ncbi:MAG TPA: Gfo/Idh/MocA family oxidoreductase, partial [bacterium]|nr:Gfo/Idh/MocA family oxidoreductase [bacterium]
MKNLENPTSTRRSVLKGIAAATLAAPFIVPSTVLGAGDRPAPSGRITIGSIGVGGRGTGMMKSFLEHPDSQVVAVCDPFRNRRLEAREMVDTYYEQKGCQDYNDFRDLLARDDIDAVCIATPDHWHVLIGIAAAEAGKDMYIEKPLSLTLAEGRAICDAVKKHKRVFQHGTQQRSDNRFRLACELALNGYLGDLRVIEVGSPASGELENQPEMPIPEGFDYDLWLGPAPWKPYTEKRCITPYWYYISDYSLGFVSGWGIHHIDIAQWGNGTDDTGPVEIEGVGVFPKGGLCDTATAWIVELKYANGVRCIFADENRYEHGIRFVGTKGWVHVRRSAIRSVPENLIETKIGPNEVHLYESKDHRGNFLECIKTRKETICPVETAHRSMSISCLSQIAMLLGRKLEWNPKTERFVSDREANRMLSGTMRSPWH